jgi:type IV pilus assembly protein PilB
LEGVASTDSTVGEFMSKLRKKLGEYLLSWETITEQQLEEALKIQKGTGKRIGQVLIDLKYATEDDVAKALASQLNKEWIDLTNQDVIRSIDVNLMPQEVIRKFFVLPLGKKDGRLKVVLSDPMDLQLMDLLRFRLNCPIDTALAGKQRIANATRFLFSDDSSMDETLKLMTGGGENVSAVDGDTESAVSESDPNAAPIIRLVHKVISEAVKQRASDIHIEPMSDRVRLRYRIDGVCHERDSIPKRMQSPILTRLKIMSGMKIDERRVPQDGRIKLKIGADVIDFRVSSCPAYHGESVVMRVLRPDSVKIGLAQLGFEQDTLDLFNKAIKRPNGIFLVTGPTGSGKTTTLYSALDVLNRPDRKIITAEDPVEYNFAGVNQCQVREDIGLTLRSMLRQAPNIILVGEIRDKEVAEVAIQAALTGHLVFSTLHTNDAPSAITRLIDMGVKPFLVASSIHAVMGQRLIRVLCPKCKQPDDNPNKFYLKVCGIKPGDLEGKNVCKPVGCEHCSGTGYRGRKALFEFMFMNHELRELAFKRSPASQLRGAAVAGGMRTMVGDGKLKVLAGVTTAEEVSRSAQVEGLISMDEEEHAA